jgi:glyoxylase-like metal-dependent hydrolase (beta-lactamase superfamily II)
MLLETRAVAPFFKNGFLLACETTREAIVIDPGDEVPELIRLIEVGRLHVRSILLTHAHMDHVSGVARLKQATGAPVAVHRADMYLYEHAVQQGLMFGITIDPPPPPDVFLEAGAVFPFGSCEVRVHHTPGHSPGGVVFQAGSTGVPGSQLFVGDTLFAGSIGRTDLPGGNLPTLLASIRSVIFAFADEVVVYPGHGPETTVGNERASNPFLQD